MDPVEYLTNKVRKVIPHSDRLYNSGCVVVAEYPLWEFEIQDMVELAWDTLLKLAIRGRTEEANISVKLTFVSYAIGTAITDMIKLENPTAKELLGTGDLFIEAFLQNKLVEIAREYDGHKAPYILKVIGKVDYCKPLLIGTSFVPLEPITGHRSKLTNKPYIKGWNNKEAFNELLNERFVKALEVLRQQPWEVNQRVLAAAIGQTLPKEVVTDDGEILGVGLSKDPRVLRLMSKQYEHDQVIAKAKMIGDKTFYQEVSCDYRGRVYYTESFLSYQGSDLARSLFLFGNKKRVSQVGYKWLCIKAACCYNQSYEIDQLPEWCTTDYKPYLLEEGLDTISVDKMTMKDRELWAINNLLLVSSTALHETLDDSAEKTYSFLAVCLEIEGYLSAQYKGEEYYSGYPVGIDGSNNGYQHLAAISKDALAGGLVSITPSAIQRDFYVAAAKALIKAIPDWFAERNMPMKAIRKGIAKRACMVRAYSAGKKRIAANMYDDLYMLNFHEKYNISKDDCTMLAGHMIDAINKVCQGPLKTTKYLQKMAEHLLANGASFISWTTPSGFPVIYKANLQHERKQRGSIKGIAGNKDGRVMHVIKVDVTDKTTGTKMPCRRSFASGIAPNVIHSLDAAHLANTIVSFSGSFAAIHDSFSTHADDVDLLQMVTKIIFAAQYDIPNFFDKLEDMIMIDSSGFTTPQPTIGELDVNAVIGSDYFFC
jgi:hypothetical protein